MTLTIKYWNTWAACLEHELGSEYWNYISHHANKSDIMHFSEVHSCIDTNIPTYVAPVDAGHRVAPLNIRQFQKIQKLLRSTHHVYFQAQINGLHDLDGTHQTVQYGNLTAVRYDLHHSIRGGMVYRKFNDLNKQKTGGKPAAKSGHSILVLKDNIWYQSMHTHMHWDQNGKIDTSERFLQFANLMSMANKHRNQNTEHENAKLIVGGDFNVTSTSTVLEYLRSSMQFGDNGGEILNHTYGVTNTRTNWYPPEKPSREADFVVVAGNITVDSYKTDSNAPSDHALITTVLN